MVNYDLYNDSDSDSIDSDSTIVFVNDLNGSEISSISGTDNEYSSDSDSVFEEFQVEFNDWEYDEIYQEDSHHVYSEKENDHYYIGLTKRTYSDGNDLLLMVNSVSPIVFFQYEFERVRRYLAQYSIVRVENARVHIMKLCILDDETYSVVLKTHWLRLVQRHWKKIYAERKRVIKGRRNLVNLRHREVCGRWPPGLNNVASLNGMLSEYKNEGKERVRDKERKTLVFPS
uniref:Uncharacterized protein n=1 Tax=viral metagenome TaxID=1070528 RepID=A0A6C0LAS0_9ZZZZ